MSVSPGRRSPASSAFPSSTLAVFLFVLSHHTFPLAAQPAEGSGSAGNETNEESEKEGTRIIPFGLPFASSDVGNGALANLIISGKTADGNWDNTLFVIGAATDRGLRVAMLNGRFKRAGGWTVAGQVGLFENPNAFYFGYGNFQDMRKIQRVRTGRDHAAGDVPASSDVLKGRDVSLNKEYLEDFSRREDLRIEPGEINPGRAVLEQRQNRHYDYHLKRNMGHLNLEKKLGSSNLSIILGLAGARVRTYSYQGDREKGDFFPESATLLDLDRPVGYDSTEGKVFTTAGIVGLEYDSLPPERRGHPNRGIRTGLRFEGAGKDLGGHYNYDRVTVYHHHFVELFGSYFQKQGRELVFAYRLFGRQTFGDIPFFEERGLGGALLRGYPTNQFIDRVVVGGGAELRFTAFPASTEKGTSLGFLIFADTGRVAPTVPEIDSYGWHRAAGGGLNFIFGDRFVIELVGGVSTYERFFSLQIGHTLDFRN